MKTPEILHKLGVEAHAAAGAKPDALVMSLGGLRMLDVIVPLKGAIGVPVVSSTPHGLWHCARMLGVKNRIDGFGMVMAAAPAAARCVLCGPYDVSPRARTSPHSRRRLRRRRQIDLCPAARRTDGLAGPAPRPSLLASRLEADAHGRVERNRGAVGRRARVDHGRQLWRVHRRSGHRAAMRSCSSTFLA